MQAENQVSVQPLTDITSTKNLEQRKLIHPRKMNLVNDYMSPASDDTIPFGRQENPPRSPDSKGVLVEESDVNEDESVENINQLPVFIPTSFRHSTIKETSERKFWGGVWTVRWI